MTDRELMQQALHALKLIDEAMPFPVAKQTITALRERLAREECESPVAWMIWLHGPAGFFEKHDDAREELERRNRDWPDDPRRLVPLYTAPQLAKEPVAHRVVVGALFDFIGWLTSRDERLVLSATNDAAPAAEAIKDFARMRSLSISEAQVQDWQEHLAAPQPREWVGLTDSEIALVNADYPHPQGFARAIEAKLREKNAP